MTRPRFSVIIPTYNGSRWVGAAVESVLRQTYPAAEVLVVDDGSDDATPAALARFGPPVRVVRRPRGGIGAARNTGLERAAGDYLAFLDHDDLWRPDKLAAQADLLARRPEADVLYADAEEFDEAGTVHASYLDLFPALRRPADLFGAMVHFAIPLMSTVAVRAAFLAAHGLRFLESASGVDDLGLLLEASARGAVFTCQEERLARRRLHAHNLSKVHHHRFAQRVVLYEELLRRLADAPPSQQAHLRWGLRDAHFRVGEWHWGQDDRRAALGHFRAALGADRIGLRAAAYAAACYLPGPAARGARALKRTVARLLPA